MVLLHLEVTHQIHKVGTFSRYRSSEEYFQLLS